jgi:transposase InsO family protein
MNHSVRQLCRTFGLSRSNHYAYCKRQQRRKEQDKPIVEAIRTIHKQRFKNHYGSPRMTAELKLQGFEINRKRVIRLMQQEGIIVAKKRRSWKTTDSNHSSPIAPNVLERDFSIGQLNKRWAGDITYLWTPKEVIYLAVIIDLGSRKVVGYAVDNHMRTSLCLEALEMALTHEATAPELAHTDRGSQYASEAYRARLQQRGITLSMSAKGDCWDNAVSESFFGTLKNELADHFLTLQDAKRELFDYWLFYNKNRLHSALGFVSPETYINNIGTQQKLAA